MCTYFYLIDYINKLIINDEIKIQQFVNSIYQILEYLYIYPTHLTFVYTGSVSCSKPLRASKLCSFIQKKRLQKNESMLDSPALLGLALKLLLVFSYWAGRLYSLCFKMSSMFSIQFRDFIFYQNFSH
ncbi:Hypothetical_protein [Hexamita inflata]|uniref:Hypothetical_protein n=1 Tax=Hexamita inflata TaxID=28002 RepID=A0AA86UL35_9EUKA|nr:Hypothetical protein HINF_LOCUS43142 [Hexamita inflata]